MASFLDLESDMSTAETTDPEYVSRKKICESYEKAGVDLPIVELETVLDRNASPATDATQRKSKIRSGLARFIRKSTSEPQEPDSRHEVDKEREDEEEDKLPLPVATSQQHDPEEEEEDMPMDERNGLLSATANTHPVSSSNEDALPIADVGCGGAYCCPEELGKSKSAPPEFMGRPAGQLDDKHVVSSLQLPEGFQDEDELKQLQRKNDARRRLFSNIASRHRALVDVDESMMTSNDRTRDDDESMNAEHLRNEKQYGKIGWFRGTRRFRSAVLLCCVFHVLLIGLIVLTAMKVRDNNQEASFLADDPSVGVTKEPLATNEPLGTNEPLATDEPSLSATEEFAATMEGTEVPTMEYTLASTEAEWTTEVPSEADTVEDTGTEAPCEDMVELSSSCFGRNSDVLVFFRSCFPETGDWIAIYETGYDASTLVFEDSIDWAYTCGDKRCQNAVFSEVIPFSADSLFASGGRGSPTYQVHLMRDGLGPSYSALASSTEFVVVGRERDC